MGDCLSFTRDFMKTEIVAGETACEYYECESYQHELVNVGGRWICDHHLQEERAMFDVMATDAMKELGLDDDECERMLEDMAI